MSRVVLALLGTAGLLTAAPVAAGAPTQPVYDGAGRLVQTPFVPFVEKRLDARRATAIFRAHDKVSDWLVRYPPRPQTDATFETRLRRWKVDVWSGEAGQIATGRVDDASGAVIEAWTGPQVAWKMARGGEGAFGGRTINRPAVWLGLCLLFLLGLADWRRPLSVRNLDLLVLLSFSVSLWYFNRGDIFTSVPLVYPPLVYLLARMVWSGIRGRPVRPAGRPLWPVWLLAAAAVFLAGFRVGLNVRAPRAVIDVGYAGVIGAHRIANGQAPYGHMPVQGDLQPCGSADVEGEIRDRIQTNGRCESSNERGDTYGPVSYQAYLPGYALLGWSGRWDKLPAAHFASILFDLLCMAGLVLMGRRFGGARLAVTLAFAWAAYPFTLYASNSNTNDAILPAFLIWGFWLVSSPWARGGALALASWTKFAALVALPLWASYPEATRPILSRQRRLFACSFAIASAFSFWILLLEPDPLHAARVFWDRTLGWQINRESPFSLWDWGQYHAEGIPDLHRVRQVLQLLLFGGALLLYILPRRKSPFQLAALTAALLIGVQLVLTHWFYLYLPWIFPFVAFVVLASVPAGAPGESSPKAEAARPLVPA